MKYNNFKYSNLFSCFCFTLFCFMSCNTKNSEEFEVIKQEFISTKQKLTSEEYHKRNLVEKFKLEKRSDESILNAELVVIDASEQKKNITDISKGASRLIFKYSFTNCSTCVNAQLDLMDDKIEQIGLENVFVLATLEKTRDLVIFERNRSVPYQIYKIDKIEGNNQIFLDNENPYFFILKDGIIKYTFVPLVEFPDLTSEYLNFVIKYFENEKNHL